MLVVEDGNGPPGRLENRDSFLEPLETRIESLSQIISGIVPVLSDDHDAINGEILATERERFGDGGEQAQTMAFDPLPSHVRHELGGFVGNLEVRQHGSKPGNAEDP